MDMLSERVLKECFGRRVKTLRQAMGLTQSHLAERSDISEEYLSKLERGLASPSFSVLANLSTTLGVRPGEFFRFPDAALDPGNALAEADAILGNLFDNLPFGIFLSTESGHFRLVSPSFAHLLGYASPRELMAEIGDIARDLYVDAGERRTVLESLPADGRTMTVATRLRCRDGKSLGVRLNMRRVPQDDGEPYFMGIVESLTGQPCGQQGWLDWMYPMALRELHHRVKNNFAMLKSILDLEAAKPEMSHCRQPIESVSHKLLAAARLHDRLYSAEQAENLDLADYLAEVLEPLREGFSAPRGIDLDLDCQHCAMDWNRALRLGLLVVELVTNALKHAYPAADGPGSLAASGQAATGPKRIHVALHREANGYRLTVADHGVGLAAGATPMGLVLVNGLVDSLGGSLRLDGQGGTTAVITIPA